MKKKYWNEEKEWKREMKKYFNEVWGERRKEIVFIGIDKMRKEEIIEEIDKCMVKEEWLEKEWW